MKLALFIAACLYLVACIVVFTVVAWPGSLVLWGVVGVFASIFYILVYLGA